MIPESLQTAFDEAWKALSQSLEAEGRFFDCAGQFMTNAVAINDAVAEVNRKGGGDQLTEAENGRLKKMVEFIQAYSVHLAALAKTRAAHPFHMSPSEN